MIYHVFKGFFNEKLSKNQKFTPGQPLLAKANSPSQKFSEYF
jgi:hypothetical protein